MHVRQSDGSLQQIPFEVPQTPEFYMGSGGLYSTASDYLKFQQLFLHEGRFNDTQILKPESVRLMMQNQIGDITVNCLKTAIPTSTRDLDFLPGSKWSLGFMISSQRIPNRLSSGSLSWAGLGNTYFWIDPVRGVVVILLMQLFPFADQTSKNILENFETALYAALKDMSPNSK